MNNWLMKIILKFFFGSTNCEKEKLSTIVGDYWENDVSTQINLF